MLMLGTRTRVSRMMLVLSLELHEMKASVVL